MIKYKGVRTTEPNQLQKSEIEPGPPDYESNALLPDPSWTKKV